MRKILLASLVFLLSVAAKTPPLDEIVAGFYPAALTQAAAFCEISERRQQSYVKTTLPEGEFVVAAYSNNETGAVRLLKRALGETTFQVVDDVDNKFYGARPGVTLLDLDADGRPEAIVRFETPEGAFTWIYRVLASQLSLLSPVKDGVSELYLPTFIDVDGTGKLSVVEEVNIGTRLEPTFEVRHFTLSGDHFEPASPLDFFDTFSRSKSGPDTVTRTFNVAADKLMNPTRLVVVNGPAPYSKASSATVRLNGIQVAGPSDFGQHRPTFSVPIALQIENTLTVTVRGEPGGAIALAIRHD